LLNFISLQLNHEELRTILFVYLHEFVNRFSNEMTECNNGSNGHQDRFYLSKDFDLLIKDIKETKLYKMLSERAGLIES
jgi:hypothetical protein